MGEIDYLVLLSRWLHIVAAALMIGGSGYALFAMLPGTGESLTSQQCDATRKAVRRKWLVVINLSIGLLLITGFANFYLLVIAPKVPAMPYHALFGVKLLAAFVIFFFATALHGSAPGLEGLRANSRRWLALVLVLGVMIVFISGALNQLRG